MCHSLNHYSDVEKGAAATSPSLLLQKKKNISELILEVWYKKSNIIVKTAFSRKRKPSYYAVV